MCCYICPFHTYHFFDWGGNLCKSKLVSGNPHWETIATTKNRQAGRMSFFDTHVVFSLMVKNKIKKLKKNMLPSRRVVFPMSYLRVCASEKQNMSFFYTFFSHKRNFVLLIHMSCVCNMWPQTWAVCNVPCHIVFFVRCDFCLLAHASRFWK